MLEARARRLTTASESPPSAARRRLGRFFEGAIDAGFGWACLTALVSVPALSAELLTGRSSVLTLGAGLLLGGAALAVIRLAGSAGLNTLASLTKRLAAVTTRRWLAGVLVVGALVRVAWASFRLVPPQSDALAYFTLATGLHSGQPYFLSGEFSYWPPGYPFFLYGWFSLFEPELYVAVIANIALFALTVLAVHGLAARVAGIPSARFSTLTLLLWPNFLFSSSLFSKELVLAALLPLSLLLYLEAVKADNAFRRVAVLIGVGWLLGFMDLTQPSFLLFPGCFALVEVGSGVGLRAVLLRVGVVAVGAAMVIAPWTLRNREVLGEWILISTNGGSNFYRANNPLATGGFTPRGEHDLRGLSELEANRVGFRLGREWIRSQPGEFLKLSLRKQKLFMGDDGMGAYEVLRRGSPAYGWEYIALKGLSNGYWWLLWWIVTLAWWKWPRRPALPEGHLLLAASFLYLFGLHAVFEANGKYHMPLVGVIALLAGLALASTSERPGRATS